MELGLIVFFITTGPGVPYSITGSKQAVQSVRSQNKSGIFPDSFPAKPASLSIYMKVSWPEKGWETGRGEAAGGGGGRRLRNRAGIFEQSMGIGTG
jgi:hypothetical protein